jgi:hypothetical protein
MIKDKDSSSVIGIDMKSRGWAGFLRFCFILLLLAGCYFIINFYYYYISSELLVWAELLRGLCLSGLAVIGFYRPSIFLGKVKE